VTNWQICIQFINGFPKPLHGLEINFPNSFIATAAAFQHGFNQSEHHKSIESR
jgi:hypothetical protein